MGSLRDVFSPLTAWKHVIDTPVTIKQPIGREAADRYRGFHQNDVDTCIGCGSCEVDLPERRHRHGAGVGRRAKATAGSGPTSTTAAAAGARSASTSA